MCLVKLNANDNNIIVSGQTVEVGEKVDEERTEEPVSILFLKSQYRFVSIGQGPKQHQQHKSLINNLAEHETIFIDLLLHEEVLGWEFPKD